MITWSYTAVLVLERSRRRKHAAIPNSLDGWSRKKCSSPWENHARQRRTHEHASPILEQIQQQYEYTSSSYEYIPGIVYKSFLEFSSSTYTYVRRTDGLRSAVDHLDPNLPIWCAVHDLCSTDPTHETCARSCRLYVRNQAATWFRFMQISNLPGNI